MFISSLELTNEQLVQKEAEFQQLLLDVEPKEKVWEELRNFFDKATVLDIDKYRYSYWRWYVWLTWDRLNSLSQDDLINIAVGQQLSMAMLLNRDVLRELMWYFVANNYLEGDLDSLFIKLKNVFRGSNLILGRWRNKEVTIAEIVAEHSAIRQRGNDALDMAAFNSKLKDIFSSTTDPFFQKYILVNPEDAVGRFTQFALFFFLMESKDVWYAVDVFMHPDRKIVPEESVLTHSPINSSPTMAKIEPKPPEPTIAPPKAFVSPPRAKKEPEVKVEKEKKFSYSEIKAQIVNQFPKDVKGEFLDISAVLRELERLAGKFADDSIRDLYIYNEQSGKFEWNDQLINR